MALSRDEILRQVTEVMVDALGVDDDEVTENATLMADLGAESIDFLDVVFLRPVFFRLAVMNALPPVFTTTCSWAGTRRAAVWRGSSDRSPAMIVRCSTSSARARCWARGRAAEGQGTRRSDRDDGRHSG